MAAAGYNITVDNFGNCYVTGHEERTGQGCNALLLKYNSDGLLIWTTSYNSPHNQLEEGYGVCTDNVGNVYIAGLQQIYSNEMDIFVRKYNQDGLLLWTTTYSATTGSPSCDQAHGIAVDKLGNVYVVGFDETTHEGDNIWLRKYVQNPPNPHTNISLLNRTTDSITWFWQDNSEGFQYQEEGTRICSVVDNIVISTLITNATQFTQKWLRPNTSYQVYLEAFNIAGFSRSANSPVIYTFANPPVDVSLLSVTPISITIEWSNNLNPSYTKWGIFRSTDNFTTTVMLKSFTDNYTFTTYEDKGLEPLTAYYYRIQAFNEEGIPTAFISFSTVTPAAPQPPRNLTIAPISNRRIKLTWDISISENVNKYNIYWDNATSIIDYTTPIDNVLHPTTYWISFPIESGKAYKFAVRAEDKWQFEEKNTHFLSIMVPTLQPARNLAILPIGDKKIKLIWDVSISENISKYNIYWDNGTGTIDYSIPITRVLHPTTYWISHPLELNKTYKFAIRVEDKWEFEEKNTDYISISISPPQPVRNLAVKLLKDRMIELNWDISPSTDVMKYNIYWDNGTGTIDYSTPMGTVLHPTTYWISPPLQLNKTYKFVVRTKNKIGFEEQNNNFITISPVESLDVLKAAIKIPQNGKRISGNHVLAYAEIVSGDLSTVSKVLFQYKPSNLTVWQDIISANVKHPNPDEKEPYFVHWNVSELPEGQYELRAVVYDINNQQDDSPPAITVFIDHTTPATIENVVGNSIIKREIILNAYTNTLKIGNLTSDSIVCLIIPQNALGLGTTIEMTVNPPNVPSSPRELISINEFIEIKTGVEQKQFNRDLILVMTYSDIDNDGVVDGTEVYESRLSIYKWAEGGWEKFPTTVDINKNFCITEIKFLSLFGLFATASVDMKNIFVFPNPYVPFDGVDDNGKPYSPTDPYSGIIFDNLPQSVEIEVYNVVAELLLNKYIDKTAGKFRWDVKDRNGNELASGIYFVVLKEPVFR